MELRRLAFLNALAELGTITRVADALSYSPSSVSVQLAELEREAGVQLLRRVGRNVELTPAGLQLASYAARALAADEQIRSDIAVHQNSPHGTLLVSFVQTPALALLPGTLARLANTAPNLEVRMLHLETEPALQAVRTRQLDLIVGDEYDPLPVAHNRDIHREDLALEDVLVAVHLDHPLAANPGPIPIATLKDEIWASGHERSGITHMLRDICNRYGNFEPDVRHRSDSALLLSALVASNRSATLLPALYLETIPTVAARPIQDTALHRTIFSSTRATLRTAPAVLAFREALARTAAELFTRSPGLRPPRQ